MLATRDDELRHKAYMDREDKLFPDLKLPQPLTPEQIAAFNTKMNALELPPVPVKRICKITAIYIGTNPCIHNDGSPYKEIIYFHRGKGHLRSYDIHANRESFFRCIRAMRRLAVRKWMDIGG